MSVTTPATDETVAGESLSPEQQSALERLLIGDTVTASAKVAGVHRATLHRWLQNDFVFQAAWNRGRAEVRDSSEAALLRLAPKALAAIEKALDGGDVQTAIALLKGCGLLSGKSPKIGPVDEGILRAYAETTIDQELAIRLAGTCPVPSNPATSSPKRAARRRS